MRILRWDPEPRSQELPKRPYRDTVLVYLGFALLIVVIATATGGGFVRAVVFAGLFWAAASAYGFVTMRRRIARARRQQEEKTR